MRKPIAILSLALATLAVGAGQAGAQQSGTPVYTTVYFSDATHSTQVGIIRGRCTYNGGVQYTLQGSQSAYSEEELSFYCGEGGPDPIE